MVGSKPAIPGIAEIVISIFFFKLIIQNYLKFFFVFLNFFFTFSKII